MKIQFELEGTLIVMYTVVRSVEYNAANNQSRLHLECIHLDPAMRNAILTFVYKIIPEEQKNAEAALNELEKEEDEASTQKDDAKEKTSSEIDSSLASPVVVDPFELATEEVDIEE